MQIHFTDLCAGKECKLFYLHLCLFICLFVPLLLFCPSFLSFSFFCSFTSPQCNPAAHYPEPPSLSQPCPISFFFFGTEICVFFLIQSSCGRAC